MSEGSPTLEHVEQRLARFEQHAHRVSADVAATVRAVLAEQIISLGGVPPERIDLNRAPELRAKQARDSYLSDLSEETEEEEEAVPGHPQTQGQMTSDQEFDFDLDDTPPSVDRKSGLAPTYDVDNPRLEDLSQYDLDAPAIDERLLDLPAAERTDGGSLEFHLDDVEPDSGRAEEPVLVLFAGSETEEVLPLEEGAEITLGRGRSCTVRLKDARASRLHCRVFQGDDGWVVEDLGSANGTKLDGEFLAARTPHGLSGNEEILVGSTTIRFSVGTPASAA